MHFPHRTRAAALAASILSLALAALAPPALGRPVSPAHGPAHHSVRTASAVAGHAGVHAGVHIMGLHRRRSRGKQQSLNWSGYIRDTHAATRASGSWKVPTLTSTHDGFSSTWVGIDGATASDGYLIQTGTEADVSGGRRSYRAWWEVITPSDPAPETLFGNLTISPGDSISASVAKTSSGRWTMRLRDNTTGHTASQTVDFAGPGASAEWIQEDTDVNGFISTAPDWGTVSFRNLRLNGANPHLRPNEAVDIVDRAGTHEDVTSAPTASGSGFTVTWLATGTRTAAG